MDFSRSKQKRGWRSSCTLPCRITKKMHLIMEYFKKHPKKEIPHPEIVDWVVTEFKKRTGKVFRDPDRGIRKLSQDGQLIKIKKGVYKYDPDFVNNKELEDLYLFSSYILHH